MSIMYGCQGAHTSQGDSANNADSVTIAGDTAGGDSCAYAISVDKVRSEISGVDSIAAYSLLDKSGHTVALFSIALGGNVECLADSLLDIEGRKTALFTIADYSQEDQLFYIFYDVNNDSIFQTERVNLSVIGKNIMQYRDVNVKRISVDSVYLGGTRHDMSVAAVSLDCDSAGIINYYEYR